MPLDIRTSTAVDMRIEETRNKKMLIEQFSTQKDLAAESGFSHAAALPCCTILRTHTQLFSKRT